MLLGLLLDVVEGAHVDEILVHAGLQLRGDVVLGDAAHDDLACIQTYPDHFTGGIRMNENDLFNFQLEYTFTADWLAELDRQLALLLSTREGTMPLDRAFGLNMDFVDMPPEAAKSLYTAEVTEKVSKFIPEVRVQEVTWTGGNTGKLFPKVVITSA